MSATNSNFNETAGIELYGLDTAIEKKKGKAKIPLQLSSETAAPNTQAGSPRLRAYDPVPSTSGFLSPNPSPSPYIPIAESSSSSASPTSSSSLYPTSNITSRKASNVSSRTSISTTTIPTSPTAPYTPKYFHSRRIKKGEAKRPWLDKKNRDPRERWVNVVPIIGMVLGLAFAGILIWDGARQVVRHEYCVVLNENFSGDGLLDKRVWTREAEVGGFGNGQFEQTTDTDENSFIKDGQLWLQPSLQNPSLINKNTTINLLKDKTCTSNQFISCVATTNTTNGTIVNPVKSARINTKAGAKIKYGRVEVTAKLPVGDWLWPAVWMLPVNDTYGEWPRSGEIDIMESRGNNYTYKQGGNNIISSALHWGPNADNDAWWRNYEKRKALHTIYPSGFHTFGLEWTEKYLVTYVDSRLLHVLYTKFDEPLWQRGKFPPADSNGTRLVDPWSQTGRFSTPFDQEFYLVLNVAVGSMNSWFEDGVSGKPWVDQSPTARKDFWDAQDQWFPTWQPDGQMIVTSVKMWQQEGYNGCKLSK